MEGRPGWLDTLEARLDRIEQRMVTKGDLAALRAETVTIKDFAIAMAQVTATLEGLDRRMVRIIEITDKAQVEEIQRRLAVVEAALIKRGETESH